MLALLLAGSCAEESTVPGGAGDRGAPRDVAALSAPPTPADRSVIASDLLALIDQDVEQVLGAPEAAQAWLNLGMRYDANAMGSLAITCYEQAAARSPEDHRPLYHLARVLERSGQPDRATQILSELLAWAPAHGPGHGRLGAWFLDAGELDLARAEFSRCRELDPAGLEGPMGLGRVAIASANSTVAIELLEGLRRDHPDVSEVRFLLGSAYRLAGRMDEAGTELAAWDGEPAPLFDPWEGDVAQRIAGYQAVMDQAVRWGRQGEAGRALEPLQRLHRADPTDSAVLEKLVAVSIDLRLFDDARRVLSDALQRDPTHYRSWRSLALVEEAAGDMNAARSAAERCLALHSTWAPGHELLARIRWRGGDLPGAVASLQSALRYGGPDTVNLQKLARALGMLSRWDEARTILESALKLMPESAAVHAL
ncbi:MAG: tetratricopeptide (TPR) repeat protein, partial [Pseudohongiellaceae bacterium]